MRATPLLTVPEAAERLRLRDQTVRVWLLKRVLPCVHIGRRVLIPAEAVERYIEEHTSPALEPRRLRRAEAEP